MLSNDTWQSKEHVWFILKELEDQTPIRGEVRFVIPWGKAMRFPGIGICFEEITENQREELCKRYRV